MTIGDHREELEHDFYTRRSICLLVLEYDTTDVFTLLFPGLCIVFSVHQQKVKEVAVLQINRRGFSPSVDCYHRADISKFVDGWPTKIALHCFTMPPNSTYVANKAHSKQIKSHWNVEVMKKLTVAHPLSTLSLITTAMQ